MVVVVAAAAAAAVAVAVVAAAAAAAAAVDSHYSKSYFDRCNRWTIVIIVLSGVASILVCVCVFFVVLLL